MKKIETLKFKHFCMSIGNLPSSYVESLSYYECLMWLCKFLQDTVIPAVNNNAEAVEELQQLFIQLHEYVENYFDNLDVQEEINNKLDEMVEEGTLQEIIADYLNAKAVFGFDTVADMVSASNLIDGSYARTMGYYSVDDGGSGLYKIRTVTNDDVVDGGSIIEMNDNSLVAELIFDENVNIKQFGAKGDGTTNDTIAIQNALKFNNIYVPNGTYLIDGLEINTANTTITGEDSNTAILKSNSNNPVIKYINAGVSRSTIQNIGIDGVNNISNGIEYYTNQVYFDQYTNINKVKIYNCNKGIYTHSDYSTSSFKEFRIDNCRIYNNINGLYIKDCSDSYFNRCTSYLNIEYGYYIEGGNHKITNCKAFGNGIGYDNVKEEIYRLPDSAFTETSDESYNPSKTYYTCSKSSPIQGKNIYSVFTGSSFEPDVTYYELTNNNYIKRYAGFYLKTLRSSIVGCEAQDNYGDGFYLEGNTCVFDGIIGDNNGLLGDLANDNIISYSSAGLSQLYSGIYLYHAYNCSVNGTFANFRNSSSGKHQLSGIYYNRCSTENGNVVCNEQVEDISLYNTHELNLVVNQKNYVLNLDLGVISFDTGFSLVGTATMNSIKIIGNKIIFSLLVASENNLSQDPTQNNRILQLPTQFKAINNLVMPIHLGSNNGYVIAADVSGMYSSRSIYYRGNTNVGTYKQLLIEFESIME